MSSEKKWIFLHSVTYSMKVGIYCSSLNQTTSVKIIVLPKFCGEHSPCIYWLAVLSTLFKVAKYGLLATGNWQYFGNHLQGIMAS
jgi:hypothetical protein